MQFKKITYSRNIILSKNDNLTLKKTLYISFPDTWIDKKIKDYCAKLLPEVQRDFSKMLQSLTYYHYIDTYIYEDSSLAENTEKHGSYAYNERSLLTVLCIDMITRTTTAICLDIDPADDPQKVAKEEYNKWVSQIIDPENYYYDYYVDTLSSGGNYYGT